MLQNLGLAAQALGVGGFPHLAAHPNAWLRALGFRIQDLPVSRTNGLGPLFTGFLKLTGRDRPMPTPIGLEPHLVPYCPPYYQDMRSAVLAFVARKHAAHTAFRPGIPRHSPRTIEATIAYCDHVYRRYGRFPSANGPFRTTLAFQAHHLDPAFYAQHYD